MNRYGYIRAGAFTGNIKVADVEHNIEQIISIINTYSEKSVDIMVFPELSVCGYTCGDLFSQYLLIEKCEEGLKKLLKEIRTESLIAIGAPVTFNGRLYNCAIIINNGEITGIVPKQYLPNYGEYYERRWFTPGNAREPLQTIHYAGKKTNFGTNLIFEFKGIKVGVEICEDLWVPVPPSASLCKAGAEIILNLSASDDIVGKTDYVKRLVSSQSASGRCGYVYSSAGWGESTSDLVFSGNVIIAEDGRYIYEKVLPESDIPGIIGDIDIDKLRNDRRKVTDFFQGSSGEYYNIKTPSTDKKNLEDKNVDNLLVPVSKIYRHPFVPDEDTILRERCEEIIQIQSSGLMKRLETIGCEKAVIGISGGLDSTLALLVTIRAFDRLKYKREGITGVTMPGLATSARTKSNAVLLTETLGVTSLEIPIQEAMRVHFKDIGQDPNNYDVTYENSQARERTQILMDLANKENGIVIGTGDMSELALGWCTYNGDQMSMYGVNAGVPKTLVKYLVGWFAESSETELKNILKDILETPISPELVPSDSNEIKQKTEDLVGPYELHDFFLYHFLRNSFSPRKIIYLAAYAFKDIYTDEEITKWLRIFIKRFFSQQFKRNSMPDGPKVGSVSLSPRGDWRMPSDASVNLWLKDF